MVSSSSTTLRAGRALADISPAPGTALAGDVGVRRPAETFLDPLLAKVLVLECGGTRLCILALDITIMTARYSAAIRAGAAERFGLEPHAVMIHATQTHSAPSAGGFLLDDDLPLGPEWDWVRFRDAAFGDLVVTQSLEAIRLAIANLQEVEIGVGSTEEGRLAFNRRGVDRTGQIFMPTPHRQPNAGTLQLRYLEGPIDPELGVLALRSPEDALQSLLLNYTCHPVHLFTEPGGIVSADWPGVWSREMQSGCGDSCLPIVINGACGDINPWHPFEPGHTPDQEHMGQTLASGARRVLEALNFTDQAVLDYRVLQLKLPIREVPPAELEAARQMLQQHPEPFWQDEARTRLSWEWMQAALKMSVHLQREREGALDYEVQVFRIGDSAWVSLPGEPFASGGLEIKLASPAPFTYIAHCTSHYAGYIPPRAAYPRGGHEVNLTYWAKLEPGALETIVETAGELLNELFA